VTKSKSSSSSSSGKTGEGTKIVSRSYETDLEQ
jgi:hypothetical protein